MESSILQQHPRVCVSVEQNVALNCKILQFRLSKTRCVILQFRVFRFPGERPAHNRVVHFHAVFHAELRFSNAVLSPRS